MATTRKAKEPQQTATDTTAAVDEFMSSLEHPQKAVVEAIRSLMPSVDDSVREGVRWNAPSYRTHEYFATTNLRSRMGVGVILHFGAKVRPLPASGVRIDDPAGLLRWLGPDRANVDFKDLPDFERKRQALQAVLRQ